MEEEAAPNHRVHRLPGNIGISDRPFQKSVKSCSVSTVSPKFRPAFSCVLTELLLSEAPVERSSNNET